MTDFRITYSTPDGETGMANITERDPKRAKARLLSTYKDIGYKVSILDVEMVREDTMATKDQEREALEEIRAIVASMGPDSYISTALKGCLEIAESNIDNDFGESMEDRVKTAQKSADYFKSIAESIDSDLQRAREEIEGLKAQLSGAKARMLSADDLSECYSLICNSMETAREETTHWADEIIRLSDEPSSIDFANAVKMHRTLSRKYEYLSGMADRIKAIIA